MNKSIHSLQEIDIKISELEKVLQDLYTERREIINYLDLNKRGKNNEQESI